MECINLLSVSIIIPVYNAERTLKDLLSSLLSQSYSKDLYDIILINDKSEDNSAIIMDAYAERYKNVKVLTNEVNLGRSKTRNIGINAAQKDLLIFLDSDCIPKETTFIETHVSLHAKHSNSIAIGAVSFPDVSENPFDKFREIRENIRKRKHSNETLDFVFLATANMSIIKKDLLMIGSFDEDFMHWGAEDIELGYRAIKKNMNIILIEENGDVVHYDERVDLEKYCQRMYNFSKYNIPILMKKHPLIIKHFKSYKMLEKINDLRNTDIYLKIPIQLIVTISHPFLHLLLKTKFGKLDKVSSILYKIYISKYYMDGVKDRIG